MSRYSRNDRVTWQEMKAIKKWVERNLKPSNNKGLAPNGEREIKMQLT